MTRKHDNKSKRTSNRPAKRGPSPASRNAGPRNASRGAGSRSASVGASSRSPKATREAAAGKPNEKRSAAHELGKPVGCALCPVFGRCGGCSALDVPYEAQLAAKERTVRDLFADLAPAGAFQPILGMADPFHYRNKVISPYAPAKHGSGSSRRAKAMPLPSSEGARAKGKGRAAKGAVAKLTRADILTGMYETGTHRLIPTDACAIENETAKRVTLAIRDIMARWNMEPYNEDTGEGFVRHAVVRVGHASGEVLATVVTNGEEFPASKSFCRELVRRVPEVTTIVQNVNTRQTNVILGDKERVLYGPGFILDTLCGLSFRISSRSFYQVNAVQTEVLYDEAVRLAGLTGAETVIDAYCGTGTIGLVAASRGTARVIGVDSVEAAIRDARGNARHNGVENAEFICADATHFMQEMAASPLRHPERAVSPLRHPERAQRVEGSPENPENQQPLVLLMDPPRAGSTPEFLDAAAALAPDRIVYISCNPTTQARDVRHLTRAGYAVRTVRPVDMFPHTDHVETVVLLSRA